jgi:diguanylate cyclase (GGDEF)-like protein/PAS domain S-box-containing protein
MKPLDPVIVAGGGDADEFLRPLRELLASLMRSDALSRGDVEAALGEVTRVAANVLRVERVSVWRLIDHGQRIECASLYHAPSHSHQRGATIDAISAPRYFAALHEARTIAAHDAASDERTADFAPDYLPRHGIGAMLDAPVLLRGQLTGILCHEHVGGMRRWAFWEELLAGTLGDFVAMVLAAAEHRAQAEELEAHRARLELLVEARTAELKRAEQDFKLSFDASPIALLMTRVSDHKVVMANPHAVALFEQSLDELEHARSIDFWADLDERERVIALMARDGIVEGFVTRFRTRSGRLFWGELSARLLPRQGELCFVAGVRDVTLQKAAEEQLLRSRDTLRTMFEAAPLPTVFTRLDDGIIVQCNRRAAEMFGGSSHEIVGRKAPDFYYDPEERMAFLETLRRDGRVDAFVVRLTTLEGRPFWVIMNAELIDLDGERGFFVGFADLSEQKQREERLRELASTDGLTGVLNRRRFLELAQAELERSRRYGHPLTLALLDADHFKQLNDRHGHIVGDDALRHICRVARGSLRRVDLLGRYGGEEFVILLPETDEPAAGHVLERVCRAIEAEPVSALGRPVPLTVSIGCATSKAGESLDTLLHRADTALYDAKRGGRNRVSQRPRALS